MEGMLLCVQPDGTAEWVSNTYEDIKRGMHGVTIDFVAHQNLGCFINDNGLAEQEVLNWTASVMMYQPLFGPAVFAAPDPDDEGNTLPATDEIYNAIKNLAEITQLIHQGAANIGQDIAVRADPDHVPPPIIVGLTDDWTFGDPLPPHEQPPTCPSCASEAGWNGACWVTKHTESCALA